MIISKGLFTQEETNKYLVMRGETTDNYKLKVQTKQKTKTKNKNNKT